MQKGCVVAVVLVLVMMVRDTSRDARAIMLLKVVEGLVLPNFDRFA